MKFLLIALLAFILHAQADELFVETEFIIDKIDKNGKITYKKNPDYHPELEKIDTLDSIATKIKEDEEKTKK